MIILNGSKLLRKFLECNAGIVNYATIGEEGKEKKLIFKI